MPEVKILHNQRFLETGAGKRSLRAGKVVPMTEAEAAAAERGGYGERVKAKGQAKKSAKKRGGK